MLERPQSPMLEGGLTEIIDKDDAEVAAQEYSNSVEVTLDQINPTADIEYHSGEILYMNLYASELGSGAVLSTAGKMFVFDFDPSISAGEDAMAAAGANHKLALGFVKFASTDWDADANGAIARKTCAIPFHPVKKLYFCFRPDAGETAINSAAGDDEELHFNFWYRRDS